MTNMVINPIAYIIYSMYVVRRKCQSSRSKPRETSYNLQALLSRYMTKCHDNKSLTINIKLSIILSTLTYFSIWLLNDTYLCFQRTSAISALDVLRRCALQIYISFACLHDVSVNGWWRQRKTMFGAFYTRSMVWRDRGRGSLSLMQWLTSAFWVLTWPKFNTQCWVLCRCDVWARVPDHGRHGRS